MTWTNAIELIGILFTAGILSCNNSSVNNSESTIVGDESCPSDGGVMRRLPDDFCIDATEVTRGNYFAWLETNPVDTDDMTCVDNDLMPTCAIDGAWGFDRFLDKPIVCVDWCDANAYCFAHGKRLCGKIDGGTVALDDYADAGVDEWFAACSAGGQNDFTYGETYSPHVCRESPNDGWGTVDCASQTSCQSNHTEYSGIFDLSGNVAEWVNACENDSHNAGCRIRGGSYGHSGSGIRCDAGEDMLWPRNNARGEIGFRCCAD